MLGSAVLYGILVINGRGNDIPPAVTLLLGAAITQMVGIIREKGFQKVEREVANGVKETQLNVKNAAENGEQAAKSLADAAQTAQQAADTQQQQQQQILELLREITKQGRV